MSTEGDIQMIMAVTDCPRDVAQSVYEKTKSVIESIDDILFPNDPKMKKVKQILSAQQEEISRVRDITKQMDDARYTKLSEAVTSKDESTS